MSTSSSSSDAMALRAAAVAFRFESCSGQPGSQQLLSDVQRQQSVPEARRMISQQPKAAGPAFVRHCRFRNPANNAVQIQVRAARLLPGLFSRSFRLPSVLLGALRALHTSSGGRKQLQRQNGVVACRVFVEPRDSLRTPGCAFTAIIVIVQSRLLRIRESRSRQQAAPV